MYDSTCCCFSNIRKTSRLKTPRLTRKRVKSEGGFAPFWAYDHLPATIIHHINKVQHQIEGEEGSLKDFALRQQPNQRFGLSVCVVSFRFSVLGWENRSCACVLCVLCVCLDNGSMNRCDECTDRQHLERSHSSNVGLNLHFLLTVKKQPEATQPESATRMLQAALSVTPGQKENS